MGELLHACSLPQPKMVFTSYRTVNNLKLVEDNINNFSAGGGEDVIATTFCLRK